MFSNIPVTLLSTTANAVHTLTAATSDSLIEYTRVTRVEPVTLVDMSVVHLPYITDALQSLNSLFAAYYMQAVSVSANIGDIQVMKMLDQLNPNRSPSMNAGMVIGDIISEEAYRFRLPVPGEATGLEDFGEANTYEYGAHQVEGGNPGEAKYAKVINEASNLSVGKLLEVELCNGDQKVKIPVSVRLIVSAINPENLVHTLSVGSKDTSVKERWHAWRAGQLEFVKDLILCQDLIDEHRKAMMTDKTHVYEEAVNRKNKNILSTLISGAPSLATASNLAVLSEKTAQMLERNIGGPLKNMAVRERMFKNTYLMLLMVIDTTYEQVLIYHRSIPNPTHLSVRDLKGASKDTGVDIAKLLQAYHAGATPNL